MGRSVNESTQKNIFYKKRMEAADYNDRLFSRETAAELLGISKDSLQDYETDLRLPSNETVVRMADIYNAPEITYYYCSSVCPISSVQGTRQKSR